MVWGYRLLWMILELATPLFSGLKRFLVESIKVAREFVQNAAACPKDAGLTRTIIPKL